MGLPELMEVTGKSKPTLSGIHVKELLNRELVVESPHPTDNRRKVYRSVVRRIGSSDLPVDQLRHAVQAYAGLVPASKGYSLKAVLQVLGAAPAQSEAVLTAQATALGAASQGLLEFDSPRGLGLALVSFLEDQGLAAVAQVDLDALSFTCRPAADLALAPSFVGAILAGLVTGLCKEKGLSIQFAGLAEGDTFTLRAQGNR